MAYKEPSTRALSSTVVLFEHFRALLVYLSTETSTQCGKKEDAPSTEDRKRMSMKYPRITAGPASLQEGSCVFMRLFSSVNNVLSYAQL